MDALPIVIALDVGEQVASGLVPCRPSSLVGEFDLEGISIKALLNNQPVRLMDRAACPAHGPRSAATCICGRPLLSSRAIASRSNSGVNSRPVFAIDHRPAQQSVAEVSAKPGEDESAAPA